MCNGIDLFLVFFFFLFVGLTLHVLCELFPSGPSKMEVIVIYGLSTGNFQKEVSPKVS